MPRLVLVGLLLSGLFGLVNGCAAAGPSQGQKKRGLSQAVQAAEHRGDVYEHKKEHRLAEESYAVAISQAVRARAAQEDVDRLIAKWHEAKRQADETLRQKIPLDRVLAEAERRAEEGDRVTAARILALRLKQDRPQALPSAARRRLSSALARHRVGEKGPVDPAPPVDPRRRGIEINIAGLLAKDLSAAWVDQSEDSRDLRERAVETVRDAVAYSSDYGAFLERVRRVGLVVRLADYRPGGQPIDAKIVLLGVQSHCEGIGFEFDSEAGQSNLDAAGRVATPGPDQVAASTLLTWTADGQRLQSNDDWTAAIPPHSEVTIAEHLGGRVCGSLVTLLLGQFSRF